MQQTAFPIAPTENGFTNSANSQRREQLHELERTMQTLAVSNGQRLHHSQDGVQPSPSYEKEQPAGTPPANNKTGKSKLKKCLHLNLLSISNCNGNNNNAERLNNGGVLSPWQQPQFQQRRVQRPSKLFPVHILPGLYLGNDETAKNRETLEKCGIRYVINVTSDLPNYFEDERQIAYLRIPVDDNCSHNLAQFFPQAISFIEKALSERASLLVHCWAGISRSVTVCLAYLMYALRCSLEEAFDRLLKQNGTIAPNFHFMEALTCWERDLLQCSYSHSAMGITVPPGSACGGQQKQLQNNLINGHHSGGTQKPRSPSAFSGVAVHPAPHPAAAVPF